MRASAAFCYPDPREMVWHLVSMPISLAYLLKKAIGSEPEESTNTRGVTLAESPKQASNLKVGGSTYF